MLYCGKSITFGTVQAGCECEVAAALVCVDGGQVDKTAGGGAKL